MRSWGKLRHEELMKSLRCAKLTRETNVLTWGRETSYKGIPRIIEAANANGAVIDDFALGIYSTWIRAGRRASLIDASEIQGALAVHHAFGSAVGGIAHEVRETGANGETIYILALTIWPAGGRTARICREGCVEKSIVRLLLRWNASCARVTVNYNVLFPDNNRHHREQFNVD